MELPIKNPSNCSVRSVIQFLVAQKVPVPEIHRQLVSVYGEGIMSIEMVRKWKRQFESGRENVHDEERSGRPSVSRGEDAVSAVRKLLDDDARLTLSEIVQKLHNKHQLTRSSVYRIVKDDLNCSKVCARWVPRLLSDEHKQNRLDAAHRFLEILEDEGESLFSRIVTGDETWFITPPLNQKGRVWCGKHPKQVLPKKPRWHFRLGR